MDVLEECVGIARHSKLRLKGWVARLSRNVLTSQSQNHGTTEC